MSSEAAYPRYLPRAIDAVIGELFAELPALMLTGPRAVGKTTTARRHAAHVVRLDRPEEALPFLADADGALRRLPRPAILDEWQHVPDVLAAVKRAVDDDPSPGRVILTGSTRALLDRGTWPGTGRIVELSMHGLTPWEESGSTPDSILALLDGRRIPSPAPNPPDLAHSVGAALQSGFPEARRLSAAVRERWLGSYVAQVIDRDARDLARIDRRALGRYVQALGLASATTTDTRTLYDAARIDRKTADAYDALLARLFLTADAPAWASNRLRRLTLRPKRLLADAALVATLAEADASAVLADGTLLGRVLETFVASLVRPALAVAHPRSRLHHLRQEQGRHEIDLLYEPRPGQVVAVEVKATGTPTVHDARHLAWLRDGLGDGFVHGVLLHTGRAVLDLGDRLRAIPLAALWS